MKVLTSYKRCILCAAGVVFYQGVLCYFVCAVYAQQMLVLLISVILLYERPRLVSYICFFRHCEMASKLKNPLNLSLPPINPETAAADPSG